MAALGTSTGSADLDGWNDADGRHLSDVLTAVDARSKPAEETA
jgi:hypothetical protein